MKTIDKLKRDLKSQRMFLKNIKRRKRFDPATSDIIIKSMQQCIGATQDLISLDKFLACQEKKGLEHRWVKKSVLAA